MKALYFNGELSFEKNYPSPVPGKGESLIGVKMAGVCATDKEIISGYMDFKGVPGHEFVGIVKESENKELLGRRVVGEINIGCGKCTWCERGESNHCPTRSVLGILNKDGAFAELLTIPNKNLHIIPDSITNEEAVFVEPIAAAFEIIEQLGEMDDKRVAILGDGKLGILTAKVLSLTGADLTLVGKHPGKLDIVSDLDIHRILLDELKETYFDVAIDCTGSSGGLAVAINITKPRGTIVVKTTVSGSRVVDTNSVVINELTIIGSRCGPFLPAIKALECKLIDVKPLITKLMPLDDGKSAFKEAQKKGVLKILIDI